MDVKQVTNFILDFTSIVYEALPFLILGSLISGIFEEMVPQRLIVRFIPRSRLLSILIGTLLGLIFPMCECGIIPIMRRLLRKTLPLSTCTAYLLAGPIINVVVMASTYVAFSGTTSLEGISPGGVHQMSPSQMVTLRVGLGFLVAVGSSLLVERQWRRHGYALLTPLAIPPSSSSSNADDPDNGRRSGWQRISAISETALHDFVDIAAFLILGALLSAFARQVLNHDEITQLGANQPLLTIVIMMGLAVLLCLCSEADAFIAASYTTLPSSAKLAFLVLGPMLDIKLYLLYTRVFRPRLIWTIMSAVVVQVLTYTIITHYVWNFVAASASPAVVP